MEKKRSRIDRVLALLIALLVCAGSLIFSSAALGLWARGVAGIPSVMLSHLALGLGCGLILLIIAANFDYKKLRPWAPHLYVGALLLTALVFVPHVGAMYGGGKRWIVLFHISIQPSEALKIASIVLASAYFAAIRNKVATLKWGFGGVLGILATPALLLILQPDLGTLGVIGISVGAIYVAAGARLRDIALVLLIAFVSLGLLVMVKPYVRDRVTTFFYPSQGQQAEGYQIKQSLIAIGSGQLLGRGFGQGVQKFTYLPEPMGDSIFAVAGEELGFIGSVLLILLFLALSLRGFSTSARAPDSFGALLGIGIATYLCIEAFINIASMLGVAPLTGIPLTFVSQGGSAMLASLAAAGILLNVSRHR